jgi:tetratricopeptide (TPR) repeat protein
MEPTLERTRALSAARAHLDRGFRFEQAGTLARALEEYRDALGSKPLPAEEIEARLRIARVHRTMAAWDMVRSESEAAIRLADAHGEDDLAAEAMNVQLGALQVQGFYDEADELGQRAIARAKSARVRGITLQNLGRSAAERRDFARSDAYFAESIDAFRSANYDIGLAVALTNVAKAALDRGDIARALDIGREAIALARRLNQLDVLLTAVQNQAAAFVARGDHDSAEALLTEALGHFTSARNLLRQAECLEIMGQMSEARSGDPETARRCYERARELAISIGDRPLTDRLTRRLSTGESGGNGRTGNTPA